jgi:hypothetical protein
MGPEARQEAIAAATAELERLFGRGALRALDALERRAPGVPSRRRYRRRSERRPCEKKRRVAAARPRDERGHFVKRVPKS